MPINRTSRAQTKHPRNDDASNCIFNPQVLCFDGVAVCPESNWSHMESSFCNLRGFKGIWAPKMNYSATPCHKLTS